MEWLNTLVQHALNFMQWWFTVTPWEGALRIRTGRHERLYGPGLHFRIPILDRVYVQAMRLRTLHVPSQTVTTKDGSPLTFAGRLRFQIVDLSKLYHTLHQPDDTLVDLASSYAASYVSSRARAEITPDALEAHVRSGLDLSQYGLRRGRYFLSDFAYVPTVRLLMEQPSRNIYSPVETESYDA